MYWLISAETHTFAARLQKFIFNKPALIALRTPGNAAGQ
jgi:hypothetical protein